MLEEREGNLLDYGDGASDQSEAGQQPGEEEPDEQANSPYGVLLHATHHLQQAEHAAVQWQAGAEPEQRETLQQALVEGIALAEDATRRLREAGEQRSRSSESLQQSELHHERQAARLKAAAAAEGHTHEVQSELRGQSQVHEQLVIVRRFQGGRYHKMLRGLQPATMQPPPRSGPARRGESQAVMELRRGYLFEAGLQAESRVRQQPELMQLVDASEEVLQCLHSGRVQEARGISWWQQPRWVDAVARYREVRRAVFDSILAMEQTPARLAAPLPRQWLDVLNQATRLYPSEMGGQRLYGALQLLSSTRLAHVVDWGHKECAVAFAQLLPVLGPPDFSILSDSHDAEPFDSMDRWAVGLLMRYLPLHWGHPLLQQCLDACRADQAVFCPVLRTLAAAKDEQHEWFRCGAGTEADSTLMEKLENGQSDWDQQRLAAVAIGGGACAELQCRELLASVVHKVIKKEISAVRRARADQGRTPALQAQLNKWEARRDAAATLAMETFVLRTWRAHGEARPYPSVARPTPGVFGAAGPQPQRQTEGLDVGFKRRRGEAGPPSPPPQHGDQRQQELLEQVQRLGQVVSAQQAQLHAMQQGQLHAMQQGQLAAQASGMSQMQPAQQMLLGSVQPTVMQHVQPAAMPLMLTPPVGMLPQMGMMPQQFGGYGPY